MNTLEKTRPPVHCPRCHKKSQETQTHSFWPFCSQRCKLIDLGQWASESYRIPVDTQESSIDSTQKNHDEYL